MVEQGNPNSITDAGVGALCARSAIMGAYLNVKVNASGLKDRPFAETLINEGAEIEQKALKFEQEILTYVNDKIK
jgi:glutamate formiminotransferase/formiminotetrahydrofolate cyclodeaminase